MASKVTKGPERRGDLLVQKVGEEIIVYDRASNKAHALNRTAALVFERLDGKRDLPGVARDVAKALGRSPQKDLVATAVNELAAADLLRPGAALPRRSVLRGMAAGLIPAVATLSLGALPAGSCSPDFGPCTLTGGECCPGLNCVQVGTSTSFNCKTAPPP